MVNHRDQLQRIRIKLEAAREADRDLKVFGAKSHQYRMGPPVSERDVCAFEKRYALALPACYRSFVTGVGNGGPSIRGSGAGPFFGIYPLGGWVDEMLRRPELFLNKPAIIEPGLTDEEWSSLTKRLDNGGGISEEEWEEERGRIFAGLLPIGTQGCTYLHALVLNGPYAGRVVNLDEDGQKPQFTFERNFLDWYERWLDEVICGVLMQDGPSWFGYTMGGDDEHLMRGFADAADRRVKLEALDGLGRLLTATEASCRKLRELCSGDDAEIRHSALQLLTKFACPMAQEPLRRHLMSDDDDCLAACQSLFWYAKQQSREWVDQLRGRLPAVKHPETFRFLSYLLKEAGVDFSGDFRPFCAHREEDIRITAFYSLGQLKNKKDLVDLFIAGLDDASARVVHTALQALAGVRDQRLLRAYSRVLNRFTTDEHYILTNLEHRLNEMGFASLREFRSESAG